MRLVDSIFYLAWGASDVILSIQLQKNLAKYMLATAWPKDKL